MPGTVFITGGTGFLGRPLIRWLVARGHPVRALVRPGSERKVPPGAGWIVGNPLDAASFQAHVDDRTTVVHLLGVTKPTPWKEKEFRAVDLPALQASAAAAAARNAAHFVFLSVAQPAPAMRAYVQVRRECEAYLVQTKLTATILRPWYVLGPGRRWPLVLVPFYKLGEWLGFEGAFRLGFVSHDQMIRALVWAVENPGARILDVPAIRAVQLDPHPPQTAV